MEKVIVFGNRSMARVMLYSLQNSSEYEVVGFTVDREYLDSDSLFQMPVVPFDIVETVFPPNRHKMIIAVGYVQNNKIRKERYFRAKEIGYQLVNTISSRSVISPETAIGDNCSIGAYTVISPDAKIGNNVFIGSLCAVGHDVIIGDHCFLADSVCVSGSVSIGSCCYFGPNSTIRNRVSIGKECVIGAGAIMLADAEDRSVYLGEPATLLPISSSELPLG
jgi:sugar O-acyltransferase (sialic acid O-acetyltransferase NeuD family)